MFKYKTGKEVTDSVGLLITILLRYPEIAKINYEPEQEIIKMSFLINNDIPQDKLQRFISDLRDSIFTFNFLEQVEPSKIQISTVSNEEYITIELYRDINTLTVNEINLIVKLFHLHLSNLIIADNNDVFVEDELLYQEAIITDMLENLKTSRPVKKLLAFRDEGKVRVFDK